MNDTAREAIVAAIREKRRPASSGRYAGVRLNTLHKIMTTAGYSPRDYAAAMRQLLEEGRIAIVCSRVVLGGGTHITCLNPPELSYPTATYASGDIFLGNRHQLQNCNVYLLESEDLSAVLPVSVLRQLKMAAT